MPESSTDNLLQRLSASIDRFNVRVAAKIQAVCNALFQTEKFKATKDAVLAAEGIALFYAGTTLMQIGEWFFAIVVFVGMGFLLFAKALTIGHWKKWIGCSCAVLFSGLMIAITVLHKPESEPWSNLQKLFGWEERPMITVSPKEVVFGTSGPTSGLGETYTFAVTNKMQSDRYNVNVVLFVNSADWEASDFECVPPHGSGQGFVFLWLRQNRTGRPLCLVPWYRLKAGESGDITLRHVKKVGSVIVTACVTSSQEESEASPTIQTENGKGQNFTTPPESIPCALSQ